MGKKRISNMVLDEVSMVGKGSNQKAHIVLMKAVTKSEEGENYPAEAFAYVPDSEKPSTWKLRLWDSLEEKETPSQVGKAIIAFNKEKDYTEKKKKIKIPKKKEKAVKKKVLKTWYKVNTEKDREDAPNVLNIMKGMDEGKTFNELLEHNETMMALWDSVYLLEESLYSIMHETELEDKADKLNESTQQFQFKLSQIVQKGDNMAEIEKLQKSLEDLQKKLDELQIINEDLKKENEAMKNQIEKSDEEEGTEDINKEELPENVRKHFEELEKRNEKNDQLIKKLLEDKENDTFIAKAEGFKHLAISAKQFGPILNKVSKALSDEDMDVFMKTLTSADEVIGKGKIFDEEGSDGDGSPKGNAIAKMDARTKEIMKADPGITKEKAFVRVIEEDPELYSEYLEEQE